MKNKNILAGIAVLAALLTTPALFSSCSKDEGKDESEAPLNTLVIDGVETPITRAGIDEDFLQEGKYSIGFNYTDGFDTIFGIMLIPDPNNPVVDLTHKATGQGKFWMISNSINREDMFYATGDAKSSCVVFDTGTLSIKRLDNAANGNPIIEVILKNGKIKDDINGDGKEHTVSLHYKGEMELTCFMA